MSDRSIVLNDNIQSRSEQRGISRYFDKAADAISTRFGQRVLICSAEPRDYGAARHIRLPRFRGSRRLGVQDGIASVIADWAEAGVLYSSYYGNAWTKAAQVFPVYDMIHELFPEQRADRSDGVGRFIAEKKRCLERAAALIAISKCTAGDILACYPHLDANKVAVVHLGVDELFFAAAAPPRGMTVKPYFLYVGLRGRYKNFQRLLIAFGQSGLAKDFDLRVISPKRDVFTPQERDVINRSELTANVQLRCAVDDVELRSSYAGAAALVYPSEHEGFGLPILEAMASGTLVCTSATSSMPEVGGDVALYFDPQDPESIADCLNRAVHLASQEHKERIRQGIARAHSFTWERCQQQTIQVLEGLL